MSRFRVSLAICAAFCLLGTVGLIYAQGEKPPVEKCGNLHTQAEMNDCAAAGAKKADAALNAAYRELLTKVRENKTATKKLAAAEKAWIVFRDAELAAEWPVAEGENPNLLYGSVHPLCYYNELATMTWGRVKALKNLMTKEEGDVCSSGLAQRGQGDGPHTCTSTSGKAKAPRLSNPRSFAGIPGG